MSSIIAKPSKEEVRKYLKLWEEEGHIKNDAILKNLCAEENPLHEDRNEIIKKVKAVNYFYSTRISAEDMDAIAARILNLNLDTDTRLKEGDLSLVEDIGLKKGNPRYKKACKVFASKYCSFHQPVFFPMFDRLARKVLVHFNESENFMKDFDEDDIEYYRKYCDVLKRFCNYFELGQFKAEWGEDKFFLKQEKGEFSLKEIDQYLWLVGKGL